MCARERMRPFSDALGEHFQVLNYDRRGRGDSGDTLPYAVDREIDDLRALAGEAGDSVLVYGHSSGAVLALRAAAAGVPIDALVVHDPPFSVEAGGDPARVSYNEQLEQALGEGRRGDAVELFMRLTGMPAQMVAGARQSAAWPGLERIAPTLAYDSRVMGDPDDGAAIPLELLERLQMPVLVLAGGSVPDWMKQAAARVAELVGDGRYAEIPGAEHAAEPKKYVSLVASFFDEQARAAA